MAFSPYGNQNFGVCGKGFKFALNIVLWWINSLLNKVFDLTKLGEFADDKINTTQMFCL